MRNLRILPTMIVALVGAVVGSFAMMLYASTHFAGVAGPGNEPPSVVAAPIYSGTDDQARIVSAVKRVAPSVVAIDVYINGQVERPVNPFEQFFGNGQGPSVIQHFRGEASGSGFIYERNGNSALIVTNAHVVRPPNGATVSKIEVIFKNGDRVPGTVYAENVGADLALVKVDGYSKIPPAVEMADSSRLESGQFAIAIGEPFDLKQSVSLGIVSGFNRDETIGNDQGGAMNFKGLLQTSAPINPGNSGGPLIDLDGRVIGVNQSTASPEAGAQGIGFAIPSNVVRQQIATLEKNPGVHQGTDMGFIGAALATVTPSLGVQINYQGKGVAVAEVIQGGPADQAGLQPGDVILSIDGKTVTTADQAVKAIEGAKPGQELDLNVWSAGVKKLVTIKVGERPADATSQLQVPNVPGGPSFGNPGNQGGLGSP
ncbi:MAG: S1C family serine protease [Vulcanimicrobiaceae bacterium]